MSPSLEHPGGRSASVSMTVAVKWPPPFDYQGINPWDIRYPRKGLLGGLRVVSRLLWNVLISIYLGGIAFNFLYLAATDPLSFGAWLDGGKIIHALLLDNILVIWIRSPVLGGLISGGGGIALIILVIAVQWARRDQAREQEVLQLRTVVEVIYQTLGASAKDTGTEGSAP